MPMAKGGAPTGQRCRWTKQKKRTARFLQDLIRTNLALMTCSLYAAGRITCIVHLSICCCEVTVNGTII